MTNQRLQARVSEKEYDFFQESYTKFMAQRKKPLTAGEYLLIAIKALNEKEQLDIETEIDEFC